jgi:YVTN family beta-propeller protein
MVKEHRDYHGKYFLTLVFASVLLVSLGILVHNVFTDSVVATTAIPNGSYGTGNIPLGVGVNTNTNMIYVANRGGFWGQGGAIFVIDGSTNSVTSKIKEESGPAGVAVNPITNKIYVTNAGYYIPSLHFIYSSTVSVIDGATNSITNTITVRNEPSGVGVNPNTNEIYVANALNNTVSVIDGSSNSVVSTVLVGSNAAFVTVNPNTNKIYVVDASGIEVIDGSTNSVTSVISGSYVALGVNPNTDKIYAINKSSTVSVIDGSTNNVVDTIPVGSNPEGITVNPSMNKIYVADSDSRTVSVIDGVTDKIINTISLGYVPTGIDANTNTNLVYVAGYSNANGVAVLVINGNNPPQSPTGLTATAISSSQIDISWNAPSDNGGSAITGYDIERSTDNGNTWSVIVPNTGSTSTTYSDTGLAHSTTYTYRVSAINQIGTSQPSNTASATTFNTIPSQPTGLKATAQVLRINLNWNAPSDNGGTPITGYMIERSTDNGNTWSTLVSNTGNAGTTYSDTNVQLLTAYTYHVSAINNIGTGNPSNTASATTPSVGLAPTSLP